LLHLCTMCTIDAYGLNGRSLPDIEELDRHSKLLGTIKRPEPTENEIERCMPLLVEIMEIIENCDEPIDFCSLARRHKVSKNKLTVYRMLMTVLNNDFSKLAKVALALDLGKKGVSGVAPITVVTSPRPTFMKNGVHVTQDFTCAHNCSFCPKEVDGFGNPTQPRSYLSLEPATQRALNNDFDAFAQMHGRMMDLVKQGGLVNKIEINVIGGTFSSYPDEYRYEFVRDLIYAANIFGHRHFRPRLSLKEEQDFNELADCRIVLIAVEIRPDSVTSEELVFLRRLGVTRIQLGIQHLDDEVLNKLNRKCSTARTYAAIKMLKDCAFKIDAHFMPNLPGSTPALDEAMLVGDLAGTTRPVKREYACIKPSIRPEVHEEYFLKNPNVQCDQLKIYPTAVTVHTEILEWFKNGSYVPYSEAELIDVLVKFKSLVFPWVRINRIARDFYTNNTYSISGSNLGIRSLLTDILAKDNWHCACIRCREVKRGVFDPSYILILRKYFASGAYECAIGAESANFRTTYGQVRLRLPRSMSQVMVFPELRGCALVRELHVYSDAASIGKANKGSVQHRGIGTTLMRRAEQVARTNGYERVAVIAAIGTRGYYRKLGYELVGESGYMAKTL